MRQAVTDTVPAAIIVTTPAVNAIAHEARASRDGTETGGILLGTTERSGLVIRHAGGPGRHATRRATSFERDLNYAQALGDWAFEQAGSGCGSENGTPTSEFRPCRAPEISLSTRACSLNPSSPLTSS
ncbi:hypothetical protein GCM10023192_15980 [Amycolatopsis samaneae]